MDQFRKAGKVVRQVRDECKRLVVPGASFLKIAETIETRVRELGAKPAFPVNISVNEIAAHYTPVPGDVLTVREGDLVKVDFGSHINGYPADTAFTVCAGAKNPMVEVAEGALDIAIKLATPGRSVAEIGTQVHAFINSHGFRPIANLTGHSMEQWNLHSGLSIPSISIPLGPELQEGMVIAIEPFVTTGTGRVIETRPSAIYRLISKKVRLPSARQVIEKIESEFGTLPFASRWLSPQERQVLPYLVKEQAIHQYPILKEAGGGPIAQAEHTVFVKDKPEVLT